MARVFLRQTMIALRARRQAYRIATDFLYDERIDVESFSCRACGHDLTARAFTVLGWLQCPACGSRNRAPAHLRSRGRMSERIGAPDRNPPDQSWRKWEIPPQVVVLLLVFHLLLATALLLIHVSTSK